jgi:hypothetical protein
MSFMGDVFSYTISELMAIINIPHLHPDIIVKNTTIYSTNFPEKKDFFFKVRKRLLNTYKERYPINNKYNITADYDDVDYYDGRNSDSGSGSDSDSDKSIDIGNGVKNNGIKEGFSQMEESKKDTSDNNNNNMSAWTSSAILTQDNPVQTDKNTDRGEEQSSILKTPGDEHFPMQRKQLGVSNSYDIPVVQGTLNPNLKNTVSRFINLDSQFRQYTTASDNASHYTLDLSDPLLNTLSIRLYSYSIPFTWYMFDHNLGNTCFWVQFISENTPNTSIQISINSGNYTSDKFVEELNTSLSSEFISVTGVTLPPPVSYNLNNGKISISLEGWKHKSNDLLVVDESTKIVFHDVTGVLRCGGGCSNSGGNRDNNINQTLGWTMGFRNTVVGAALVTADAVADFNGPKYIVLSIDDYNQNHIENGLISISETSNVLKMPDYYTPDMPRYCLHPNTNNTSELQGDGATDLLLAGKSTIEYTSTSQIVASAPRTLTNAQMYTINEISKNRNNNTKFKSHAPTNSDILAIIPIKRASNTPIGTVITEFSGALQDNVRNYFGPVNISRLRLKLSDDRGNILNLNGSDWCATLIATCLYQY